MSSEQSQQPSPAKNWLAGGRIPGLPWVPVAAQMHDHAMTVAGVPAATYYRDAETFVGAFTDVASYYGLDVVMPEADIYNFELEAMGGTMIHGENAMPTVDFREPLVREPKDLLRLKTPDFHRDGRLPYALDIIRLRRSRFRTVPLGGTYCAIFSLAVGLRGYGALIRDMRKRPDFVRDLFGFITDQVLIPYIREQKEYCGIEASHGADAWACVPNLSVREMKEWLVPWNRQLEEKARTFGVRTTAGTGDYSEEDLDKFDAEVLHGAFDIQMACRGGTTLSLGMGRWHEYPLGPVREYAERRRAEGKQMSVLAGVNARLLRDGPVERIVDTIRRFVDAFGREYNLTIWLANIPADAPAEHIHAAVAAVHAYGRLPIPDSLDDLKPAIPKRESFRDWKKNR